MHLLAFSPLRDRGRFYLNTEPVLVKTALVLPLISFAENCGILSVLRGIFYDMSYKNGFRHATDKSSELWYLFAPRSIERMVRIYNQVT